MQLSFDLPAKPALGRDDFFVSPSNATAVAMVEGWRNWPARKLALIGPEGAGKTHLAHVWAGLSGARLIAASDLPKADIPALCTAPVAVEDVPTIAGDRTAEEALFHLHNLILANGHSLLVTARSPQNLWGLKLPDLASRMDGTPAITLEAPDDALLAALLMKLFTDRQIAPTPDTIPYLVKRIDRAFDAAQQIVTDLDSAALSTGRPVSRALARDLLETAKP